MTIFDKYMVKGHYKFLFLLRWLSKIDILRLLIQQININNPLIVSLDEKGRGERRKDGICHRTKVEVEVWYARFQSTLKDCLKILRSVAVGHEFDTLNW